MADNEITVNGKQYIVAENDLKNSLLYYLRENLGLTGAKNGCGIGACGACTVLSDGRAIRSCVTPVVKALGKKILTIEGLASSDRSLHPVQTAFLNTGAVQCGFCTPGMIMKAVELLQKRKNVSRDEIRNVFRNNLCRCTGYEQIFQAVELADADWERDIAKISGDS